MAALTIGGWFASLFVDKLAEQVTSYVQHQWEYPAGVKAKLQKLEQHLTRIKAVIHVADKGQIENPGLSSWFKDLKDAVHAAEDVLDNIEYQILEDKVKEINQVSEGNTSSSYAVAKTASTLLKCIVFGDEDLNELDAVVEKFDSIASSVGLFLKLLKFDVGARQHNLEWRVTTSTPIETKVVGREDEIANLVNLLTEGHDESTHHNNPFDVISIHGIGGVGKTTLAQIVYNNSKVEEFFDLRVWVCVSHDFDIMRLTKEIIEAVSIRTFPNFHKFRNLDKVHGFLRDGLLGKRFLIVLDDVWNVTCTAWEKLRTPFMCGKEGSCIIITTRNQEIANMMSTKRTIALEGLRGTDYQLFFTQCAFGNANPDNYPKLKSIASEIAAKLEGSPLAVKTVGGILKQNLDEECWREILQSNLWQLEQGEDGISRALRLSYEHLPAHLKQCFVYCSLFPKEFLFNRDELIRMWMAHGFIVPNSSRKRMEDIGRDYFELLLSRSFFQHAAGSDNRYIVHGLMQDLAQSVSPDEYCIIKEAGPFEIPKRVRHLFFAADDTNELLKNLSRLKTLRSLIISGSSLSSRFLQSVIMMSKRLRVLVIQTWFLHLPRDFSYLTHLRYLSLNGNLSEKNESISKLYHLQGLRLLNSYSWPTKISQLINLRYLKAPTDIVCSIPDIGRLTSLQILKSFEVRNARGYELKQLRGMRQLRGRLCISNLHNVENKDDICDYVLINKELLTALELEWSKISSRHVEPEDILESLQPHCNLKELKIKKYLGINSPSWLDTTWLLNIEIICFESCMRWEVLPPLGQLPFLKVLQIKGMGAVKQIGHEFYGSGDAFLNLRELVLDDMQNLEKWSGPEEGCSFFPHLRKLHITNCQKLKCPLPVASLLKKLVAMKPNPMILEEIDSIVAVGSFVLFVDDISLLPRWLPVESLSTLQELEIKEFSLHDSIIKVDEDWFRQLTSLKRLVLSS